MTSPEFQPAPASAVVAKSATTAGSASSPDIGRSLPHSLVAEERLLACCQLDGREVMARCALARLVPHSFYDAGHRLVFAALLDLYKRQEPTTPDVLAQAMKDSGDLERIGGYDRIVRLSAASPTTAETAFFIATVRTLWIRRELILFSENLRIDAHDSTTTLPDMLSPKVAWLETALSRAVHGVGGAITLAQRIDAVSADVALRAAGKEDRSGWISTGLDRFDRNLLPLGSDAEDHIVLLGGGSGHGKSALARQIALSALRRGQRVLNYTIETGINGWIRQAASNLAQVDLTNLAALPKDHLARFHERTEELKAMAEKNLFVFAHELGSEMKTIDQLARHARSWSWQHGAPHLIVIDYLQLLGVGKDKRCNNREQEVAHVSHEIQSLQRELGCVVLVLAQYNETGIREMAGGGKRDDKGKLLHRLPRAGDFRESQAMYHDADRVLGLYRPAENCLGVDQTTGAAMPEQWICQIKRRYGREGFQRCWFEKRFLNFREFNAAELSAAEVAETAATGTVAKGGTSKDDWKKRRAGA